MAQPKDHETGSEKAADIATVKAQVNLRKTILLGTFGSDANPGALLRLPSGDVVRVGEGDAVEGGEVAAIEDGKVVIAHGGNTTVLIPPR